MRWDKKLNILAPLRQAERCVSLWLKESDRALTSPQKQRVAALMARYFHNEDQVTDQLMLSFLRHYSGQHEVDMEDPTSVRREIKAVLDQSQVRESLRFARRGAVLVVAACLGIWAAGHQRIDRAQQAELKAFVHQIALLDQQTTPAAIWAETKTPLHVRSYQEMSRWDYWQSRRKLIRQLDTLNQSSVMRAGM